MREYADRDRPEVAATAWLGRRLKLRPGLLCDMNPDLGQIPERDVRCGMQPMPLAAIGGA